MKICYIANARIPTEKAHGIQIMKMCEAFALSGNEVELIVPVRDNPIMQDAFDFYHIKEEARDLIKIRYIKSINLLRFKKVGFWLQTWWFSELASIHVRRTHPDVVYSRDYVVLLNMLLIHKNLVWEAHRGETGFAIKLLLKRAKIVSITYGLMELYTQYIKDASKTLIAPDAVDLNEFDVNTPRDTCKRMVGLPTNKKIALYWGHLYGWKGVQIFADASDFLNNYELAVVVGGHEKDIQEFRDRNQDRPHLLIVGHRPRSEIALFMRAADVLVLPNSGKEKISSHYTSPLKLFENMASGTPIVASDLPSLREILNDKNALFFAPDDPASLATRVKQILKDPQLGTVLATKALEDVEHYTWKKRAQKIIAFIKP